MTTPSVKEADMKKLLALGCAFYLANDPLGRNKDCGTFATNNAQIFTNIINNTPNFINLIKSSNSQAKEKIESFEASITKIQETIPKAENIISKIDDTIPKIEAVLPKIEGLLSNKTVVEEISTAPAKITSAFRWIFVLLIILIILVLSSIGVLVFFNLRPL